MDITENPHKRGNMNFMATLKTAHASIKALRKEIDRVEEHARRMAGNNSTIPFDKDDERKRTRYGQYNAIAHQLREEMGHLEHRLPQDGAYRNLFGWAMVFDDISRQ